MRGASVRLLILGWGRDGLRDDVYIFWVVDAAISKCSTIYPAVYNSIQDITFLCTHHLEFPMLDLLEE